MEYFGWGKYGGIGKATRDIARGLTRKGVEVSVAVPLGVDQRRYEYVDNVSVFGFPLAEYPLIGSLLREIDTDVYHSQDPNLGTWLAKKTCKDSLHVLTCQNPKTSEDWGIVNEFYPLRRKLYNRIIDPGISRVVRELDGVYCQANYTREKTQILYDLGYLPGFLPNPIKVPEGVPEKAGKPTVLFLGRFDEEKNPESFMKMASMYPDVDFIAAGVSHNPRYDNYIRSKYGDIGNLYLPGFVNGEAKEELLSRTWVLVNTSVSECLPVSFLEAAAYGCCILSSHDPDGFASRFGLHIGKDEICSGLKRLLHDEAWREKGKEAHRYVKDIHEEEKVIERHIKEYSRILK